MSAELALLDRSGNPLPNDLERYEKNLDDAAAYVAASLLEDARTLCDHNGCVSDARYADFEKSARIAFRTAFEIFGLDYAEILPVPPPCTDQNSNEIF